MAPLADPLQQALDHHQAGRWAMAEALYRQLLAAHPDHADAHHLLGFLCHQQGRPEPALTLIRRAIELLPQAAIFHANLGVVLLAQGQGDAAEASLLRAHLLDPAAADVCNNLGSCSSRRGQHQVACVWFQRAVALQPGHAQAQHNLGLAWVAQGRADLGLPHFQQVAALRPESADAQHDLGSALADVGQPEAAVASLQRALALRPDSVATLGNLVTQLTRLGRADQALPLARRCVALQADLASAWTGLGMVLQHQGALAEARAAMEQAALLDPQSPAVGLNLALCRLLDGDLAGGWPAYESRLAVPAFRPLAPRPDAPRWQGQPLAGQTLLLQAEQGLGDTLQFARYATVLARQGGRVLLQVQPPLLRLLASLPGPQQVIGTDQPLPRCDLHSPLLSLPLLLGTRLHSIPADIPYLHADAASARAWQMRLDSAVDAGQVAGQVAGQGARLRVGLCWRGSPTHAADRYRSMQLADFDSLADLPGVHFVSLQRDRPAEPAAALAGRLIDLTADLSDMADMAGLVAALDLVISVDTAVCHLAGAMGRPVWVLLHAGPDFRWLMGREDSPWYPTARLFRQQHLGDWKPVLAAVVAALLAVAVRRDIADGVGSPPSVLPSVAGGQPLGQHQALTPEPATQPGR